MPKVIDIDHELLKLVTKYSTCSNCARIVAFYKADIVHSPSVFGILCPNCNDWIRFSKNPFSS